MSERKPIRCRLGMHTVERSQGDVGYCLRGCGDLRRRWSNGRTWTRYVEPPGPNTRRPGGLPRKPPAPPPMTPGIGNVARPVYRMKISVDIVDKQDKGE